MDLPEDVSLPFFAYGLFKPDQIAFHKIHDLVSGHESEEIQGVIKERDGIPIYAISNNKRIYGYLIHFKNGNELEAYERISEFEPKAYYYWNNIKTKNQIECNILSGRSPDKGTEIYEGSNWTGANDPYFSQALHEIKNIIDNNNRSDLGPKNLIPFLRLQMAYMLLWTSIERYASMKYYLRDDVNVKIKLMANEDIFKTSLLKNVNRKHSIVSAKDLKRKILDPTKPQKSLFYYYSIRSNTVHRGKAVFHDYNILKPALIELLAIFEDMIDDTWNSNNIPWQSK